MERAQLLYKEAGQERSALDLRLLKEIDLEREKIVAAGDGKQASRQSRLYSPISGTVTFVETLKPGDSVNAYQTIVTVADPSSMQLTYAAGGCEGFLAVEPACRSA